MKRKKRGNSLIVVVTTCMFVTTVSAATLSMVSGNYKARVVESKRVENLYSSDSGLDVTYNIIGKTFNAATKYGYYEVEALKNNQGTSPYKDEYQRRTNEISTLKDEIKTLEAEIKNSNSDLSTIKLQIARDNATIESDTSRVGELIKLEFKRSFRSFVYPTTTDGSETGPSKLLDSIINSSYVNTLAYNSENPTTPFTFNTVNVQSTDNAGREISIPENGVSYNASNGKYTVTVQSTFRSISGNTAVTGENSRTVQATYVMTVPDYNDIFNQQVSGELQEYLALKDRVLTVGGNMNISGANDLMVNGNVFVQGVEPTIGFDRTQGLDDRTYEKYNGGITISSSGNVNFNNDVVTRNTFNIQDGVTATIGGNLYGRNAYVGNIASGNNGFASDSTLYANGRVILDNDLVLKANSSTINIKEFYGINDKNINYDDLNTNPSERNIVHGGAGDKVKSSSSIIVNGNNSSAINISDSAYIMGTAHIDTIGNSDGTNEGYQTGESGAVKGNYIAYSVPLNEAEQFDYYNPMQLLKDSNVFNKAEHFANYWNDKTPDTGGINWPGYKTSSIDTDHIWSIGAVVYKIGTQAPKVIKTHYSPTLESTGGAIYNERLDFAKYVYKFGQEPTITDYDNSNEVSFDSLMDLTGISNVTDYVLKNQADNGNGQYAIFNADSSREIKIKESSDATDSITDNGNGPIEINVAHKDNGYTLNAVIATAGNVSIENDDIILTGNIICNGNLNITGKRVKINYHKDIMDKIQTENYSLFQNVFVNSISENQETTSTSTSGTGISSTGDSDNITYDLKRYLQNSKWNIIK